MRQKLISFSITYKKLVVSIGETICFTPGNTLFQALKLKVSSG